MRLTILGCSGSMAGPDSPASSYLVTADGYQLVLDMGNGSLGALQRHLRPHEVDAVVLSHLHADHCIDMTSFIVALRFGPVRPANRIPVYGPTGTKSRLEAAYDPVARKLGLHELFDFTVPTPGLAPPAPVQLGPFAVSFALVNHPVPTYAIRLEHEGRSLVYSGDTGESEDLVELAQGADLLLCEASFSERDEFVPDLHLTGRKAGEHAARAGVGKLVITHVQPWNSREEAVADAETAFDGPVVAASADAVFEI
jgi:ribonuclease BN (tRNA processing enzyme)